MRLPLFVLCCILLSAGLACALTLPMAETELNIAILSATEQVVDKIPLPRQADAFRREFAAKLRNGRADRKDYENCKKGIEALELPEHKRPFYLQLAEYHRYLPTTK